MKCTNSIHPDLLIAQKLAYEASGLTCSAIAQETESKKYGACTFEINNKTVIFRVAKITPTKIGLFVALWKGIGAGPIMPYDAAGLVDLFVVSVRNEQHFGQFVFPKKVLEKRDLYQKIIQAANGPCASIHHGI